MKKAASIEKTLAGFKFKTAPAVTTVRGKPVFVTFRPRGVEEHGAVLRAREALTAAGVRVTETIWTGMLSETSSARVCVAA